MLSSFLSLLTGLTAGQNAGLSNQIAHQLKTVLQEAPSTGLARTILLYGSSADAKKAAQWLGHEKKMPVYVVDITRSVSKFIADTEKNLNRVFKKGTEKNAILFFDEADALFGKRSKPDDAEDRPAAIKITWLLKQLEQYPGLIIISAQQKESIDSSFTRRIRFKIDLTGDLS